MKHLSAYEVVESFAFSSKSAFWPMILSHWNCITYLTVYMRHFICSSFYLLFALDTIIHTVQVRKLRLKEAKKLWSRDLKPSSMAPEPTIQIGILHFQNNERRELITFTVVIQSGCFFLVNDSFYKVMLNISSSWLLYPCNPQSSSVFFHKGPQAYRQSHHFMIITHGGNGGVQLNSQWAHYRFGQAHLPPRPSHTLWAICLRSRRVLKRTLYIPLGNLCYFCLEHSFNVFLDISTFQRYTPDAYPYPDPFLFLYSLSSLMVCHPRPGAQGKLPFPSTSSMYNRSPSPVNSTRETVKPYPIFRVNPDQVSQN